MLVLLNFLLVIALVAGRCLQLLYFGQLRRSEVELVCERSWYSLVGTLLAVSIFRDDFSVSFVILFGVLLFLKIFHWLSAERVASIMQSPSVPRIFHARMVSILTTLFIADLLLVGFSMQMLITKKIKVGMMVLFTSEFIILTALLLNTIAQYVLNCIDMAREEPWEAKSLYVLYVDLAHDAVRLCTHTYFFILLTRMYGIPLSLIHDLYSAGRSCTMKVNALIRYRQAVKKMETKYPNASVADLQATDGTCIICREDMVATQPVEGAVNEVTNITPKKLSCGHIFHFRCLRSWLERQQSCPTCRRMILDDEPESTTQPTPAQPIPQQQQQQQNSAAPPDNAGSATQTGANASPSGSAAAQPTPAEQAYDSRLQGFLQRLQSDLRKVREEGNLSARQASSTRRSASRSGRSTPRPTAAGASSSIQPSGIFGGTSAAVRPNHSSLPRSNAYVPSGALFPSQSVNNQLHSEADGIGGLWMPPPPSSLYPGGRRPVQSPHSDGQASAGYGDSMGSASKGKGKARETDNNKAEGETDDTEGESQDPMDPREAIRQATLKRFGQLDSTSSPRSTATPPPPALTPPVGMIPLFDPTQIADFQSSHLRDLPHPLLSNSNLNLGNVLQDDLAAVLEGKKRGVQEQIALLSGIQARIDTVIADLTRVLDVVASSAQGDEGQH